MHLYFLGKAYPVSNTGSASFIVRVPDLPLMCLSRNDLRGIAQSKYGPEICRPSYPASATLWKFMEAVRKKPSPLPRRIPHVRMVRAAALQPGMRLPKVRDDGRYIGEHVVIGVAPCAWGVNVTTKWLAYRPGMTRQQQQDQYAAIAPLCRHYAADDVLLTLVEWRDKVAL